MCREKTDIMLLVLYAAVVLYAAAALRLTDSSVPLVAEPQTESPNMNSTSHSLRKLLESSTGLGPTPLVLHLSQCEEAHSMGHSRILKHAS